MLENEGTEIESGTPAPEENLSPSIETPKENPITDLETLDKFTYGGREWTPKDLQGALMMHHDYTRKTQELAEERKYYDNLQSDLDRVKQYPELAEQFKSIYPEKYHKYLGYVYQETPKANANTNYSAMDPAVKAQLDKFEGVYKELEQKKIEAIDAELDQKFKGLQTKYPYANEKTAITIAQALVDKKVPITDKVWDNIWKSVHDETKAIAKAQQAEETKQQKNANSRGRDIASGGGTPGQAPKLPRTVKEAAVLAMQQEFD